MPVVEVEELSTVIAKWAEDIREHNGAKSKTSWDYIGSHRKFRFVAQEDGSSNGKHTRSRRWNSDDAICRNRV